MLSCLETMPLRPHARGNPSMTENASIALDTVPIPTGPHRIGTTKYDLEDVYRKDFKFPKGRLIPIQIYFPMEKGPHAVCQKIFEERAAISPFEPLKAKVHSQQAD